MTTALTFEAVSFSYGANAVLRSVSFALAPGDGVALLGPNGAGKTTLTRLTVALARPAEGRVLVGDWDTRRFTPQALARRVGYVFQHADRQLFARTLRDDVAFGPHQLGATAKHAATRAAQALAALGLDGFADAHPYDLSPAHRKLAALAGVLALEPRVLVLDEPTTALDRSLRQAVVDALRARRAAGVAVLAVTHDLAFAAEALDRAVVLEGGCVRADRPLADWLWDLPRGDGFRPPAVVELARALGFAARPVREREAALALAERCRSRGGPGKF